MLSNLTNQTNWNYLQAKVQNKKMSMKEDEWMLKENRKTQNENEKKKQAKESPQRNKSIYRYTYTYIYIKCSDINVFVISEHLNYSITCDPRIRGSTIILKLPEQQWRVPIRQKIWNFMHTTEYCKRAKPKANK